MALDCYIIKPVGERTYRVLRYKAMELLDTRLVSEPVGHPRDKRERIVQEYIVQGKPATAIYWIENGTVQSTLLVDY